MVLMLAFVLISCLGAFATSENPKKLGILASSIKITDTKVEYIEYKDDGAYFVEETISGNMQKGKSEIHCILFRNHPFYSQQVAKQKTVI